MTRLHRLKLNCFTHAFEVGASVPKTSTGSEKFELREQAISATAIE